MNNDEKKAVPQELLWQLITLPQKIVQLHGVPSLPELVLHELCHDSCFAIDKAAYFIDNPDFDRLRGIAGYARNECGQHKQDLWLDPYAFDLDMQQAPYHQEIKQFSGKSLIKSGAEALNQENIADLIRALGMEKPITFSWGTRHENHGLLLLESSQDSARERQQLLNAVTALLSLCL